MALIQQDEFERFAMSKLAATPDTIVFGLGKTGLSVARFLHSRGEGFMLVDTRELPPEQRSFLAEFGSERCLLGELDLSLLNHCRQLIVSPGVPLDHPFIQAAMSRDVEVIGDIELFQRYAVAPIIGVTGSNGKSTVVTMITDILNASGLTALDGGNIGVPALDLLAEPQPDFYVLELSSFQLESVKTFAPKIACVLNVSPDHMDRYPDFESYAAAKCRIYRDAERLVLNSDDAFLRALRPDVAVTLIGSVTDERPAEEPPAYALLEHDHVLQLAMPTGERLDASQFPFRGKHNLLNALAAIAVTDLVGITRAVQLNALKSFAGLPHRTQLVARQNGVEWIDDSKGTNVGATCAAIAGLLGDNNGILIAGGVGKGADFTALADALHRHVREVVLFGRDAALMAEALSGAAGIHQVTSLEAAVSLAADLALPGDTVLFSPACASFDMFADFNARGDAYQHAVSEVLQA